MGAGSFNVLPGTRKCGRLPARGMGREGANRRVGPCESCGAEKWIYDFDEAEGLCTSCYVAEYES